MAKSGLSGKKKLKILFVASEVVPFAKTGGLADVAGALPKALAELGHDVRVAMPLYKSIDKNKYKIRSTGLEIKIDIALCKHTGKIKESVFPGTGVPVYFVENSAFFGREELYRTPKGEYWDNAERFIFFNRCVVEMIRIMDFQPDIIHCNDWHTGLIPVYLKTIYESDDFYKDPDFEEEYFSGGYDISCPQCKGNKVIPVVNRETLSSEQRKDYDEYLEYKREMDTEMESDRRTMMAEMGFGW